MPCAIVRVPNQDARNTGIHSRSHQEGHSVLDFRMCDADIGNDGVSNDSWDQCEKHNDSTQLETIGDNGYDDCQDGGHSVRDHGPKLGFVRRVAELDDDGGEEQAKRVETGKNTKVRAGAEPGGDAEDTSSNFRPLEGLMMVLTRKGK